MRLAGVAAGSAVVLAACGTPAPAPGPVVEAAMAAVRQRPGLHDAVLHVGVVTTLRRGAEGPPGWALKLIDRSGGLHGVALDATLREVDAARLAAADRQARRQRQGALSDALVRRLAAGGGEVLPVLMWLAEPVESAEPPAQRAAAQGAGVEASDDGTERLRLRSERVARRATPLLARLEALGAAPQLHAPAPLLSLRLPAAALRELAFEPTIESIDLDLPAHPEMEVAKRVTGLADLHAQGTRGQGVRVAVINASGGLVEPGTLLLPPIVMDSRDVCAGQVDEHATGVAGAIVGRRITIFGQTAGNDGSAPAALLRAGGSCSTRTDQMMDASTRAADWGARVINLSWGLDTRLSPNLVDRFYDDMVFHRFITVVKSAGNRGCQPTPPDGNVTTPGLAYNVITVGGFDDRGTEDRADDRMYDCSGLHDPLSRHGDRNKPELVAPAVEIDVVTSGPANIVRMSGTSLAAPLVAGAAALFIERQGLLAIWPEIHKALLMATATHNIEGARARSDADGAGALMANVGAQLLQDTRRWNGLRYTCSGSTPATLVLATLPGSRRQRHRVAIAWSTDPGDPAWPEQPSADIDLVVRDSGGRTVASSLSFDNSYEVVEFDNLSADTFTVEARRFRCDRDTWLGWAWHTQALARP